MTERGKDERSINRDSMNKIRIEGVVKQGERAEDHEALVTKAKWRRCGGKCDEGVRPLPREISLCF
jgi:hypothetical protein